MKKDNQLQEHTSSYYAASVNHPTSYPMLAGNHSADICVVGGGFTGVATALTLAERGYSVALVEANRIGWGASGRNGGQIINGISGLDALSEKHGESITDMIWDIRWRGNDIIYERVKKYNIQCDLKQGFVETAVKPRHLEYLNEYFEERQKRNFPYKYEVWNKEKTQSSLGTDAYIGAFACYRDGHLHPLNLCIGEARAATQLGVKIFEQSPVIDIQHGQKPTVKTSSGGYIKSDAVLIAGNAYHTLDSKHLSNLVFPAGSYIIATEPLPEELANEINPLDVAVCDLNEVMDYYRLSADKRLLYGGQCNYSGRDPADITAYIKPRMLEVYPQLKNIKIDYEWGGKIGITVARKLAVGCINKNVFYCGGYSGHGVNATHIMGEIMADAISGTMEKFDLFANEKHLRIPGTRWMGNQIIALGMLYYRLKDLL